MTAAAARLLASDGSFELLMMLACSVSLVLVLMNMLSGASGELRDRAGTGGQSDSESGEAISRPLPRAVQDAKGRLQANYRQNTIVVGYGLLERNAEGISADESGGGTPVDDVFINVAMLRQEDLLEMFRGTSFGSYGEQMRQEHIFQSSKAEKLGLDKVFELNSRAVIAIGSAGIGKTTAFCSKLPYDWSQGRLLEDVDLLLCFELRDEEVLKFRNTEELLCAALDLSEDEDRRAVLDYVRNNAHRVCIVLDGVDECNMAKCSMYMKRLLQGKAPRLQGLRTVLTSRPCQSIFELSQPEVCQIDRYVEVTGFSSPDIDTYIRQVLPGEEGEQMVREIDGHGDVKSLLATPFIAALSCTQYQDDGSISKCATTLFEKMVLRLLCKQNRVRCNKYSELPDSEREVLTELSAFAFRHFVGQKFIFDELDVHQTKLSDKCLRLGVLVACKKSLLSGRYRQYRFSHLMLQEHLAALHAATNLVKSAADVRGLINFIGVKDRRTWIFWQFLFPLVTGPDESRGLNYIMEHITNFMRDVTSELYHDMSLTDHRSSVDKVLDCNRPDTLYAWNHSQFPEICDVLRTSLQRHELQSLADDLLTDVCSDRKGSDVVGDLLPQLGREPTDELFVETLLTHWKDNAPLTNGAMLYRAVCRVQPDLIHNERILRTLLPVADPYVPDEASFIVQNFMGTPMTSELSSKLGLLLCMCELQITIMCDIMFSSAELELEGQRALSEADFGFQCMPVSAASFQRITKFLANILADIKDIRLYQSQFLQAQDISEASVDRFFQVISKSTSLQLFYFPYLNKQSHIVTLSELVGQNRSTLQELDVSGLSHLDTEPLFESLALCSQLTVLRFTGIQFSTDAADLLSALLLAQQVPLLKTLHLDDCDLGDDQLATLAQGCCCCCERLACLSLVGNKLSRMSLDPLHQVVQQCSGLISLYLHKNPRINVQDSFHDMQPGETERLGKAMMAFAQTVLYQSNNLEKLFLFDSVREPRRDLLYDLLSAACGNAVDSSGQPKVIVGPVLSRLKRVPVTVPHD
eukprot:scpid24440/ scgid15124/ Protein NLRC5; Caterpiller protein 16.1; Nucleotide-binding oligomerization domain protein 27; Nucleotide-binding oligomerization domain protein 4